MRVVTSSDFHKDGRVCTGTGTSTADGIEDQPVPRLAQVGVCSGTVTRIIGEEFLRLTQAI